MAGEAVQVDGLRGLSRGLKAISEDLPAKLKAAGKEAAEPVATLARQLSPYDEGTLVRTIRTGATQRSATIKAGGRRAPYAGVIHFGWTRRHIHPQPFLYEALDRRRDEVIETFTKGVEKLLDGTRWED